MITGKEIIVIYGVLIVLIVEFSIIQRFRSKDRITNDAYFNNPKAYTILNLGPKNFPSYNEIQLLQIDNKLITKHPSKDGSTSAKSSIIYKFRSDSLIFLEPGHHELVFKVSKLFVPFMKNSYVHTYQPVVMNIEREANTSYELYFNIIKREIIMEKYYEDYK
ncbi:MAG: DUF2057 domain-containing protein [Erysipelothrix sp.]|nr:DUF2057 domain-containing protein [Erysipelothrix sp.]